MYTPDSTTMDQIRALIAAQLDMLESAVPLTADQLEQVHDRAEEIRMLFKEIGSKEREANLAEFPERDAEEAEVTEPHIFRTRIRAQSRAA